MTAVTLRLSKHHSAGNDFLVALASEPLPGSDSDLALELFGDPAAAAIALCHRRRGIGADGLVLGIESADQPRMHAESKSGGDGEALGVQAGPVRMRLWNSDGSEAEISGNGLRCLAQAVARSRGMSEIDIDTPAGPRRCRFEPDNESVAGSALGRVEIGAVTLDALDCAVASAESGPGQLAVALNRVEGFTGRWRTGSVGNPHVVVEVADPDAVDLEASGPTVEACFDGGANVHFAAAAGPGRVRMRIWERGAGVTESCGSGAAVAAAVFAAWEAWADLDGDRAAAGAVAGSSEGAGSGAAASAGGGAMAGAVAGPSESAGSGAAISAGGGAVAGAVAGPSESIAADAARSGAVAGEGVGNEAGEIVVVMPGGDTRVHLGPPAELTGPVVHIADIEVLDMRPSC